MRIAVVIQTVGLILRIFGLILVLPLAVDLIYGFYWESLGFVLAGVSASLCGEIARRQHRRERNLSRIEGLAVVASSWLAVALFGAIPYMWNGLGFIDSAFESMSGFTTTGATIFQDFGLYSHGIFFWRGFTQWLGGMGVIALFIAVLPALAIAGRQMFFAEAPGPDEERLTPRIRDTAIRLWALYVGLTATEIALLKITGLPLYDAICNSLTTMAAGGFSPHPLSIGGYQNARAEWVFIAFMFLAGANYSLQYRAFLGKPMALFRDEEFRVYAAVVIIGALLLGGLLYGFSGQPSEAYLEGAPDGGVLINASTETIARQSLFQVLTILTTAGFATDDFDLWSDAAKVILLVLMFIGGCAGSAGGGPKIVRAWLILKFAVNELYKALHPRAVKPLRLGGRVVPPEILRSIVAFLLLYLLVFALSVVCLVCLGSDLMTGITASIATLGNIGPGFGTVGPMANYAHLHPLAKTLLFFTMWIGRLEVMTVLVFLQPHVWRMARYGSTGQRTVSMG
jgi:trk system potassium uptake protein TrkH